MSQPSDADLSGLRRRLQHFPFGHFLERRLFGREWGLPFGRIASHYVPGLRDVLNIATIDGIIWTLDIEMKFYLICASGIFLFRRSSLWVGALPIGIFIAAALGWSLLQANASAFDLNTVHWYQSGVRLILASQFIVYMFIGVVFHYLHRQLINVTTATIAITILALMFLALLRYGPDKAGSVLLPAYTAGFVVFTFAYRAPQFFRSNRVVKFFADISYPLYVVHGIFGYVLMRILLEFGTPVLVVLPAAIAFALGLAWLLHITIEKPSLSITK